MMKYSVFFLVIMMSLASCREATPIPIEKESFIGSWVSFSGFQMEIQSTGIAKVVPITDMKNPDFAKLDVGITPQYAEKMFVGFEGDTALYLLRPQLIYKSFRIDREPYLEGDTARMILNGVLLIKQKENVMNNQNRVN